MKIVTTATLITICLLQICSCQQAVKNSSVNASLEFETDQLLVNYALSEHGTQVFVSDNNYDHPAETLNNGITSSENWGTGEGWEAYFDGAYEFAKYTSYGERSEEAERLAEQMRQAVLQAKKEGKRKDADADYTDPFASPYFDDNDYKSSGLTRVIHESHIPTAMGWVVFELPQERTINRVVIYTIDSEAFPAKDYGVKDLAVQYWAPEGWRNVDGYDEKRGEAHNIVQNNEQGRVTVHFKPVQTSRIRLVIRYTNDTEIYGRGQRGGSIAHGYYRHIRGTIRLVEVQIYGPEDVPDADEHLLDALLLGKSTDSTPEVTSSPQLTKSQSVTKAPEPQIESVLRAYESAYKRRDLPALMATISPNYWKADENYAQLERKMEHLFQTHTQVDFAFQRLRIQPSMSKATVEADYAVALTQTAGAHTKLSGTLFFTMTESESGWQIARIDTQER